MRNVSVGVIGGTGLYDFEGIYDLEEINVGTPFGDPSDIIVIGKMNGLDIAFLPRHGRGHRILPNDIPYKANIYALKSIGVQRIIAINSVGSLKEEIEPGSIVIPDQVIDCTKGRPSTFFGNGIVAHVSFSDPFCSELRRILYKTCIEAGTHVHKGGIFIAMEGPSFSSRAESNLYRSWGADIIGMTILPEAKLAREAEICYASIACVTDYDCWKDHTDSVTADIILEHMKNNIEVTKKIIKIAVMKLPSIIDCICSTALKTSLVTHSKYIPPSQKEKLKMIIGKYI